MVKISKGRLILSLVTLIAGLSLFVYPVVATVINNNEHQKIVKQVMKKTHKIGHTALEKEMARADAYNRSMTNGPFLDPFLSKVVPKSSEYHVYKKTLDFGDGIMGSIHIPSVKIQLPIYHGTSDEVLAKGVGHLFGSSLPVGGNSTKSVLTGHSGMGTASMFDNLREIKNGDPVFINIGNKTFKYEVYQQKVVLPDDSRDLYIEKEKDLLVLITCTPYGINSHRLLVFAKRVAYEPSIDGAKNAESETPWRFWMYFSVAAVVLSVLLYLHLVFRRRLRKKNAETERLISDVVTENPSGLEESPDKSGGGGNSS